ncbi:MAG: hypothetical protein ACNA78_04085 [Balneolaceae bacterium]
MKRTLIILTILPLLFLGCDDLFSTGDTERVFDGEQLGLFPLFQESNISAGSETVEVQLIAAQRDSDLSVNYAIGNGSTAQEGVHFTFGTPSPVTLSANTSTVNIVINYIEDSLDPGQRVDLFIELTDANTVEPAENLKRAEIRIRP